MPQPTSAPAAVPPVPDRLSALLDVVGKLADQQQALLTALAPAARPTPAAAPAAVAAPPAGLSLEDVRSVVSDLLGRQQATAARSAARAAYVRDHLSDLPDAYRRLVPETDDAAALADAEQTVRRQFRVDLRAAARAAGEPAPAVGGDRPGGEPPAAAVDYAALSPLRQIELGLRGAGTGRAAATVAAPDDAPEADAPDELFVGAD